MILHTEMRLTLAAGTCITLISQIYTPHLHITTPNCGHLLAVGEGEADRLVELLIKSFFLLTNLLLSAVMWSGFFGGCIQSPVTSSHLLMPMLLLQQRTSTAWWSTYTGIPMPEFPLSSVASLIMLQWIRFNTYCDLLLKLC
jgi:hypothetical protein